MKYEGSSRTIETSYAMNGQLVKLLLSHNTELYKKCYTTKQFSIHFNKHFPTNKYRRRERLMISFMLLIVNCCLIISSECLLVV